MWTFHYRWRLLLTLSLVNSFYIISGFLMNFKEISRFMHDCCDIKEPFAGKLSRAAFCKTKQAMCNITVIHVVLI